MYVLSAFILIIFLFFVGFVLGHKNQLLKYPIKKGSHYLIECSGDGRVIGKVLDVTSHGVWLYIHSDERSSENKRAFLPWRNIDRAEMWPKPRSNQTAISRRTTTQLRSVM